MGSPVGAALSEAMIGRFSKSEILQVTSTEKHLALSVHFSSKGLNKELSMNLSGSGMMNAPPPS